MSKSLKVAQSMIEKGQRDSAVVIKEMKEIIGRAPLAQIDYVEIVDMDRLNPVAKIEKKALVAMAIFIGKVRLIDNTILRTKE